MMGPMMVLLMGSSMVLLLVSSILCNGYKDGVKERLGNHFVLLLQVSFNL